MSNAGSLLVMQLLLQSCELTHESLHGKASKLKWQPAKTQISRYSNLVRSKPVIRERSGRVLDSRWKGYGFEPHWRHCIVSLSKTVRHINPSLVLVQPRKTHPDIAEKLLTGM